MLIWIRDVDIGNWELIWNWELGIRNLRFPEELERDIEPCWRI